MKRRKFLELVGGAAATAFWPLPTLAQQASKSYRIGYLALLPSERTTLAKVFLKRLHELGYSEDKNMKFDYRSAEGRADRVPELAAELVRANPDVLVAGFGTVAAKAAMAATSRIPIVFTGVGDPVGAGLVAKPEPPKCKCHRYERASGRTIGQAATNPQRPRPRQEAVRGAWQP